MKVEVVQLAHARDLQLPAYASTGAAGMDLVAAVEDHLTIHPHSSCLIPTGLKVAIPTGFEVQIRPRSGLALKHSVGILNSPGTIDSDYRGEVMVILTNFGDRDFIVHRGDRIAQMVVARVETLEWEPVVELTGTQRSEGGFGSSGKR